MKSRLILLSFLLGFAALVVPGCNGMKSPFPPSQANNQAAAQKQADPQRVQATNMSFSVRYVSAMADIYDRVQKNSPTAQGQVIALQCKILAAVGAFGNAVNANPLVGMMDMAVMAQLTREAMESPWATEAFGAENQATIVAELKKQEADIWSIAGSYLTAEQITELHGLAARWRKENPQQRFVGGAHLVDFPEAKQPGNNGALQLANGVFNLVRLDPFAGLDPAVKQVEESRILGERMFFYVQYMPTTVTWQIDLLYFQMLAHPDVVNLMKDTAAVAGSTTRFSDSTEQFVKNTGEFAKTIEEFRTGLPELQATLVKQVNELVATQSAAALKQVDTDLTAQIDNSLKRINDLLDQQTESLRKQTDGIMKQANTDIAAQRDEALKQLNSTVTSQQDLIAKNLQGVMDASIDRLYERVRTLVLIAAGSLFAVLVLYRLISGQLSARRSRP